ncbi:hypothetical protein NST61_18280 [Caldifermentibacillus hisashii]|uniref:hypothetical protein n=1 Tax=Caldifermentibacillus hisashii TaxID=996558 RepID=UPI0034D3CBBC
MNKYVVKKHKQLELFEKGIEIGACHRPIYVERMFLTRRKVLRREISAGLFFFLFLKDKKEKLYTLLLHYSRSHSPLQSGHCHRITRSAFRLDMPIFLLKWVALP